MKKNKDWFHDYFKGMKRHFKLKQNVVDKAMDKVDRFLLAKHKGAHLTGKKNAVAVNIFILVAKELNLPIKLNDIGNASGKPTMQTLANVQKNMKTVFKEWFSLYKKPTTLMPKYC